MNKEQEIYIEWELYKAIRAFLECVDNKEEKENMIKKAVFEFNEKHGTTTEEVLEKLNKMLDEKLSRQLNKIELKQEDKEP